MQILKILSPGIQEHYFCAAQSNMNQQKKSQ